MSLLLTRTCEYAILVSLQKGRFFSHSTEYDIFIQSKLELRLPAAVDDLIPPASLISTAPVPISREGDVGFNTTLAYLISTKLLQRLREHDCEIMLHVKSVTTDAKERTLGTFCLRVAEAKMVVHHGPAAAMDKVNRFVADRGEWRTLGKGEEVKAGLFIVAMPNEKNANAAAAAAAAGSSSSGLTSPPNGGVNSPMLELKSLDFMSHASSTPLLFSDSVTTSTNTALSSPSSQHSFKPLRQNIDLNIERLANEFRQIKVKQQPQLLHHHHQQQPQQRVMSPSSRPSSSPSLLPPQPPQARMSWPLPPPPPSPSLTKSNNKQLRYHQIGKGVSPYTFYFRIIDADHYHLTPRLGGRRGVARKPFFTYRFLSHAIQCPASSISTRSNTSSSSPPSSSLSSSSSDWPTCFHFRGHLVDIQKWLNDLRFLEVSLLLCEDDKNDNNTSTGLLSKETVIGMAHVPLANLAFYRRSREQRQSLYDSVGSSSSSPRPRSVCVGGGEGGEMHPNFVERTFPVHGLNQPRWWQHHRREREGDHQEQQKKDKSDPIATVTVRFGLVSGWWTGDREEEAPTTVKEERDEKSTRTTSSFAKRPMSSYDLLDWFKKKKAKVPPYHTSTS